MKKRIFPICLSFLISAAFLAVGIYFTYCFVKHPARNFAILAILPAVISAGIYAAYTYFTTVGIYAGNENNSPAA